MEGSSKKQRTHERIVREASRLVRERGAEAMGVDHVMDAVGLTRGGFYAHFDSKSALVTRAVEAAFEEALVRLFSGDQREGADAWLARATLRYLSRAHVEAPGRGCAAPSLAGEVARGPVELRRAFTAGLSRVLDALAERLGDRRRALFVMSTWVGALTLARALDEPRLADELLDAARAGLASGEARGP
jgi:TetR/AcrR family transcriptional repressor of nem operon